MSNPRILIVENSTDITGALTSVIRSSSYLRGQYEFIFILPQKSKGVEFVKQQGFSCLELPLKEIRKNFFSLLFYFPFLIFNTILIFRLIRKLKIDLVVNNDFYNLLPVVYTVFGGKVPFVCYVRFRPSKFPSVLVKLWGQLNHRFAAAIIAVSEIVRKELSMHFKVVVIGNELPSTPVKYKASHSTLILYPANYTKGKGHEFALRSFAAIHKHYPEWRLRFVGSDMGLEKNRLYKQALQAEGIQLGIDNKISWANFADDVLQEYSNASIVLNFSESESFSLTCLEAMYCGRAVVATNSGGPSEIIDTNKTGILVPLNDLKAMIQGIEFLIQHPKEREMMAFEAYQKVRIKFSNENTIQELGRVYSATIQDKL